MSRGGPGEGKRAKGIKNRCEPGQNWAYRGRWLPSPLAAGSGARQALPRAAVRTRPGQPQVMDGLFPSPRCGTRRAPRDSDRGFRHRLSWGGAQQQHPGMGPGVPGISHAVPREMGNAVKPRVSARFQFPPRERLPLEPWPGDRPWGLCVPRLPAGTGETGSRRGWSLPGEPVTPPPPAPGLRSPGTDRGWAPLPKQDRPLQPGTGFARDTGCARTGECGSSCWGNWFAPGSSPVFLPGSSSQVDAWELEQAERFAAAGAWGWLWSCVKPCCD